MPKDLGRKEGSEQWRGNVPGEIDALVRKVIPFVDSDEPLNNSRVTEEALMLWLQQHAEIIDKYGLIRSLELSTEEDALLRSRLGLAPNKNPQP